MAWFCRWLRSTDWGISMDMLMGYRTEDWHDIYRIFKFDNNREPKDLFDILKWWESQERKSPEQCFAIAAKLSECRHNESSKIADLMVNFITGKK